MNFKSVMFHGYNKGSVTAWISDLNEALEKAEAASKNLELAKIYSFIGQFKGNLQITNFGGYDKDEVDQFIAEQISNINNTQTQIKNLLEANGLSSTFSQKILECSYSPDLSKNNNAKIIGMISSFGVVIFVGGIIVFSQISSSNKSIQSMVDSEDMILESEFEKDESINTTLERNEINSSSISLTQTTITTKGATETTLVESTTTTKATNEEIDYNADVVPKKKEYVRTMYVTTDITDLRIRCGPGYDYKVVYDDGIPAGTAVDIYAEQYDKNSDEVWGYVTYNGYSGWATERYLINKPTIIVPSSSKYYATMYVDTKEDDLTMRYGPSSEYGVITMVIRHDSVDVYADQYESSTGKTWSYICYKNQWGWVNKQYLSNKITTTTTTSKKTTTPKTTTITTTTTATTTAPLTPIILPNAYFYQSSSSSSMNDEKVGDVTYTYSADNLIDWNYNTCWSEGKSDDGIGEYIEIYNDEDQSLNTIYIANGLMSSEKNFYNNNRVKDCIIEFSDGTSIEVTLDGEYSQQPCEVHLPDQVSTNLIRLTILSVYSGDKYQDTCISEIFAD